MKKTLTSSYRLCNIAGTQSSHGAASCPAFNNVMRKGGFFIYRVDYKPECLHAARYGGGFHVSREYTRAFFISKKLKKYMEMVMRNGLIEGMEEDVAKKYVELYEHITRIACEIDALGKAIEIISLYGNSDTFYLGSLGSIIKEKSDEICILIDSFVLYPTIYLELKERKEDRK